MKEKVSRHSLPLALLLRHNIPAVLLIWFSVFACFGVSFFTIFTFCVGVRGGSVVERRTPEREVGVRNLPPPCCVHEQDTFLSESTGNTQEAVVPSRHD